MKKAIVCIFIIVFISACSIFGVHFNFHNPKRAGKFPVKTEARSLLGNQDAPLRTCYDVKSYDLHVNFSGELKKGGGITGWCEMGAQAVSDVDTLQVDLHANMQVTTLYQVVGLTEDQKEIHPAKYFRKYDAIFVVLPVPVKKGELFHVVICYAGAPPDAKRPPWLGGFVRKKDDQGDPWWGVACQYEGASMWWPCKDVTNDEADETSMTYTVPKGITAVGNGQLVAHIADDTSETWNWKVSYPINLYDVTFYLGKFRLLHDTYFSKETGDTLQLNHYVLEQHYDTAAKHFQQLKDHLAVYELRFGPYPFYRDGFKLVESPYAGMEHQTAIAYGNKFRNNNLGFDYIILHETAHEWWGNSLTALDLAEAWLHEGFATYAECLYVEKTKGYQAYLQYLNFERLTIINRRPIVGPYGQRYFNFRDGDIYTKGAWVLHTLRTQINNDSVFFDILKTFATRYAYQNVTTKDFIAVINEKTHSDYQWFFDQYVYNRFVPELEYYKDKNVFYYRWNPDYSSGSFQLKVPVGGIRPGATDTIRPQFAIVDTMHCSGSDQPYLRGLQLVKMDENRKLKSEFIRAHSSKKRGY